MRNRTARPLALAGAPLLALLMAADTARAQQVDTNPPLPNVMLLIDNSGSMERMINGNTPETDPNPNTPSGTNACNCKGNGPDNSPTCDWTDTGPNPNRWNILQQALTGSLTTGYSCVAMPRTGGTVFANEYEINGIQPYDANYYLPFHRLVAQDATALGATTLNPGACVVAPGGLNGAPNGQGVGETAAVIAGNATDFTGTCSSGQCAGSLTTREYGLLAANKQVACTFAQNGDGAIPEMKDLVRFGSMMFDTDPSAGIGVTTGANPQALTLAPFTGMWTYYPGWSSGAACGESGNPANCATTELMAVGARNPGAPAWEGRLVGFPTTNDTTAQEKNNSIVSEVVLAARPYGATPTAGMFAGAKYFFLSDPTGPQQTDPYVQGGCRNEYIILLTDGAPNMDLQPYCQSPGKCPFLLPQQYAAALYNNGNNNAGAPSIQTFVIGFAVSAFQDQGTLANCSMLAQGGSLSNQCQCGVPFNPNDPNQALQACCALQCIASAGGTTNAYFADTQGSLQSALGSILAQITKNATTRTVPAYSPVIANVLAGQGNSNANVFLASFTPSPGQPWSGDVQRERYICPTSGNNLGAQSVPITPAQGDDFSKDLNSNAGPARTFIAFQPATIAATGKVDSTATIRPYVATNVTDGLGQYQATTYAGTAPTIVSGITPGALNVPTSGCPYVSTQSGTQKYLTQAQCATMLLNFEFAQSSSGTGLSDFNFISRVGDAFGDVFHANPIVVGPPGSLLQDPLYVNFRQQWGAAASTRAVPATCPSGQSSCRNTVVYVATNDGLLHAFWADETTLENNEMWAMLLPQAATLLPSSYPSNHEFLLDGSPVVKDVVWERNTTTTASNVWHTMLVAGYGSSFPGYYAVDVTNPDPTGMTNGAVPNANPPVGPVLRWQLTKMPAGNYPLFGQASGTPAITTLFMDPDNTGAREIGVAILPGGQNGPPTSSLQSGGCQRWLKTSDSAPINSYTARANVRCWGPTATYTDAVVGRSLTVVRLDTGEIIRTFARKRDFNSTDVLVTNGKVIDTALDSPMTGTPVVYPTDVGTDTTKVFVGDADGTIWKFDLSSSNPNNWTGELYLDLYNASADTNGSTSWNDGQPFQITPVVSLDPAGEVVLNAATGTTQTFDTNGFYYVYSITEKVQGSPAKLRANVNWWLGPKTMTTTGIGFDPGERVSGPMTVFNGTVYFSTYAATPPTAVACQAGTARLWGDDFVRPVSQCGANCQPSDLSQGGVPILQAPPPATQTSPPPGDIIPSSYPNGPPVGAVIPGVSIMNTPACATLGNPQSDQYVFGATHSAPQNFNAGSFSLFSQVGKPGGNGGTATGTLSIPMNTPIAPTQVDSWAAVLE
jgi:type IV pilus assembly protein PilY1